MSNGLVLLRALLLSGSQLNVYRHTTDPRKRRRIVGGAIGMAVLFLLLMAYCVVMCIGYSTFGLIEATPHLCALSISALAFVLTLFKTNGYLFGFREYDLLMALPFETRTVAACKFSYMYVTSLPWYLGIAFALMVGYGIFAHPHLLTYPVWLLLSLVLPVIPMLAASFLGFLVARVSAGSRHANTVHTLLSFVFVLSFFALRFLIDDLVRNDQVQMTVELISEKTDEIARLYAPAAWFQQAVAGPSLAHAALLLATSAVLFVLVFLIVGRSYRAINTALETHAPRKAFTLKTLRQHKVLTAIAFKEFKRMTSSTVYMVNGAMGQMLATLLGVTTLLIGFDRITGAMTQGTPLDATLVQPALPFVVHFLVNMVPTTACSPSLEGKNYWIVQTLPLEAKTLYQGKMLFNLCLAVPFMALSTVCLCIATATPVLDMTLYLLLGLALCAYSTAWGCACGVRHLRLDWANEVEVIKQGAAVTIYLLPNLFVSMGLIALTAFLGTWMDHRLLALAATFVVTTLAVLSYRQVMRLAACPYVSSR